LEREILALSQELRKDNNVIDNIWYRNPSKLEDIGDEKNRMTNPDSNLEMGRYFASDKP